MAMASKSVLLLLLIVALFVSSVLSDEWKPIKNLKAPEVQEAAKFAVTAHNKQTKEKLKFVSVVRGEEQVVAGSTSYRFVIAANIDLVFLNFYNANAVRQKNQLLLKSFKKL